MFILIITVLLLILFSFVNIFDSASKNLNQTKISGKVIVDLTPKNNTNQTQKSQEIYSMQSYSIFYFILITLILVIAFIAISLVFPRIRKYT
jgi:lipopolysaccharide export LptBFGC system permease protein LptF